MSEKRMARFWSYALGEILLLVIGILIALQINNWNEDRKERKLAATYLDNLELDLQADLQSISLAIEDLEFYEQEGRYSLEVLEGNVDVVDKDQFILSLIWNNHFHLFEQSRSTYEDLIGSGNIRLITNNNLKVALSKYYLENDWMAQFGQRAKDTYWYLMREEMLSSIDPAIMSIFYKHRVSAAQGDPTFEQIDVNFSLIRENHSLRDAIARALSLRVWQRDDLRSHQKEIEQILSLVE